VDPCTFETFLYLMQNVLLIGVFYLRKSQRNSQNLSTRRKTIYANISYSHDAEDIAKRELEREFGDGKFLETYSSLGGIVLALGPDKGEFLFGVRGKNLRTVLLKIINNEEAQTLSELCRNYALNQHIVESVLNHSSLLFNEMTINDGRVYLLAESLVETIWRCKG